MTVKLDDVMKERADWLRQSFSKLQHTTRRDPRDIIRADLDRMMRRQVQDGIGGIFDGMRSAWDENNDARGNRKPQGGYGQKEMEMQIDQMVASCLTNGPQTSNVLRILFGIVPSLIGR